LGVGVGEAKRTPPSARFLTFGNIFGLALYDREQRNVGTPQRRQV
jgi:hypothetical protein